MKSSVIWFSFRPDAALLQESIKSVQRVLPEASLTVCDDGFCPVPRETRAWLDAQGVTYRKTFYQRGGNLLGHENLKNQVREMVRAAEGSDVLIKIDCDTLLLKTDWVDELGHEPKAVMAGSYKGLHNYPMGHCYAVRARMLPALLDDVETYPGWAACYEDYEIGTRLHRLCNGDYDYSVRYRSGYEDGFVLCGPTEVHKEALNGRVISCGFSWGTTPPEWRAQYKAAQLAIMQRVNGDLAALDAQQTNTPTREPVTSAET